MGYAMLSEAVDFIPGGYLMSDLAILAVSTKSALLDLGKQTNTLGTGLQNAAVGDKSGAPNLSVQYLLDISDELVRLAAKCDELSDHE